jgi:metal-responsive CopG/Arc/MetJ family transcriptional regulator
MAVKVTVNLPESTVETLKNIAQERGTTVTEALRQVIESQNFLQKEIQSGNNVLIQNPGDKTYRQVLFNIPSRNSNVA